MTDALGYDIGEPEGGYYTGCIKMKLRESLKSSELRFFYSVSLSLSTMDFFAVKLYVISGRIIPSSVKSGMITSMGVTVNL